MATRTAVIGAGPAGCAAAARLAGAGREVVVFERDAAPGGRTTSWHIGDAIIDSGAGFFTNFYPTLSALLPQLELEDRISTLSRTNILVHDGRAAEMTLGSVRSFLAMPFLRKRDILRMTMATAAASIRYRKLSLSEPETLAEYDDRSIRDEAMAGLGERLYDFLVRPGIEPFWYFSCEEVSRSLFFALQAKAATACFFSMLDGMGVITERLVRDLDVRTGTEVHAIEPEGAGFRVASERFDEVVVATTASTAARIVPDGSVAQEIRELLVSQDYVPNVHAAFRVPRASCPPQATFFPCGPGAHDVAAVSFNSHKHQGSIDSGEEIVSVYLGADESASLLEASDPLVFERAWELARGLVPSLPATAEPLRCAVREEAIPVHGVGRYRKAAVALAHQRAPLVMAGDYLATATVDGALRSGVRAAEVLLA
jgi:oxygen-dependent protoporphyrinogen oxidase